MFGILGKSVYDTNTINIEFFDNMRKYLLTLILLAYLTSCYPPRIIYGLESVQPNLANDSIRIVLNSADIISVGMLDPLMGIDLEIQNERSSVLYLSDDSRLELHTESEILQYENSIKDTMNVSFQMLPYEEVLKYKSCRILPYEKRQQKFSFKANDINFITYNSLKEKRHKLFLSLDLIDENGNRIEKKVVLVPIKTKRMRYEKKNDE